MKMVKVRTARVESLPVCILSALRKPLEPQPQKAGYFAM